MAPYRPPGRNNRSGRTQADTEIFEGLPVKQWTHAQTRVSLQPPALEAPGQQGHDRWGEPPMPRDWQLLQPWTQHLLRLARSGKLGQKRKANRDEDADGEEYNVREENDTNGDENAVSKNNMLGEDRAFIAKKWRHVPEHALTPEHLHLEYLARSRKGLPSFYHNLNNESYGAPIPMRKTKVAKTDTTTGEVLVYHILVPEGQSIDNEVLEDSEYAGLEPVVLTIGAFIEGLGTANLDGVLVGDIRGAAAVAHRRNRPPVNKKKGGPGRGKKRVTFTNPDGSTYTTIVPNATKIVPQPGQTVKHVAKGEEAAQDISAEEAARLKAAQGDEGDEDEDGDEDGDDDGDDDDREEGELVDDSQHDNDTKPHTPAGSVKDQENAEIAPDVEMADDIEHGKPDTDETQEDDSALPPTSSTEALPLDEDNEAKIADIQPAVTEMKDDEIPISLDVPEGPITTTTTADEPESMEIQLAASTEIEQEHTAEDVRADMVSQEENNQDVVAEESTLPDAGEDAEASVLLDAGEDPEASALRDTAEEAEAPTLLDAGEEKSRQLEEASQDADLTDV